MDRNGKRWVLRAYVSCSVALGFWGRFLVVLSNFFRTLALPEKTSARTAAMRTNVLATMMKIKWMSSVLESLKRMRSLLVCCRTSSPSLNESRLIYTSRIAPQRTWWVQFCWRIECKSSDSWVESETLHVGLWSTLFGAMTMAVRVKLELKAMWHNVYCRGLQYVKMAIDAKQQSSSDICHNCS